MSDAVEKEYKFESDHDLGHVCEHGSLKRQCLPCELIEENTRLREGLRVAVEALDKVVDCLADMHESPCKHDEPEPKAEDIGCMACWAFEEANPIRALEALKSLLPSEERK